MVDTHMPFSSAKSCPVSTHVRLNCANFSSTRANVTPRSMVIRHSSVVAPLATSVCTTRGYPSLIATLSAESDTTPSSKVPRALASATSASCVSVKYAKRSFCWSTERPISRFRKSGTLPSNFLGSSHALPLALLA